MGGLDYVALGADSPSALSDRLSLFGPISRDLGWRCAVRRPTLCLYVPEAGKLTVTVSSDGRGVLIGDCFRAGSASPATGIERRGLLDAAAPGDTASRLLSQIWGRYVFLRQGPDAAAAMRDPSGALDCLGWRSLGCMVWASGVAGPSETLLPQDMEIDRDVVARLIARPGEYRHGLALTHLHPCTPGALVTLGPDRVSEVALWTPAGIYRRRRRGGIAPDDIRSVVEHSTRALASLAPRSIGELSGGLDSAIVAAALGAAGRASMVGWINHYTEAAAGDERRYARATADHLGLDLAVVRRDFHPLCEDDVFPGVALVRPATNDVDIAYSRDMASRALLTGADGIVTGQGGDAVFFQMPTPLVALDELVERTILSRPRVFLQTARWMRRSAWPRVWLDAWRGRVVDEHDAHPWLQDLRGVPPAKALQVRTIAACQTFHQPSLRNRSADLLHPLLSQPVLELGLSVPAPDLTVGGRDRALIRDAFSGVLPRLITARSSKGDMSGFFGRDVVRSLPFLRRFLLQGRLADCGLLDTAVLEAQLTHMHLLEHGGSRRILSLALIEGWFRDWEVRLERLRTGRTSARALQRRS